MSNLPDYEIRIFMEAGDATTTTTSTQPHTTRLCSKDPDTGIAAGPHQQRCSNQAHKAHFPSEMKVFYAQIELSISSINTRKTHHNHVHRRNLHSSSDQDRQKREGGE